jgi:hypothetical protein
LRRIATQVFGEIVFAEIVLAEIVLADIWPATRTVSSPEQHTMPNRTAKFLSAVIACLCAGVPLTASRSATPAPAADECLLAPKNETPDGSHWYFRIEHPSNRRCWYLREEGDAQTAPSNSSASARPVSPAPDKPMPGSVANARAELRSPRTGIDQDRPANTGQMPAAANAAMIDSAPPANPADANMLTSVVASRWPAQLSANSPVAPPPQPASANPPADVQANDVQANAAPPPSAVAPPAAAPLAAADASMAKQSGSAVMLLAVIVGALSVAGLIASAVFRVGGRRRRSRSDIPPEVRPTWDLDRDLKRSAPPLPFPASAIHRPNIGAPLELQEADDADERDRIEQMLERLARSAQG